MKLFRRTPAAPSAAPDRVTARPAAGCEHLAAAPVTEPDPVADPRCEDCTAIGENVWAHLRQCLQCGHVACCDSSPHRHATAHYRATGHPVMRSVEPGETWRWCYTDALLG